MRIIAFSTWDEIAPRAESWDRLAGGVPFRSWAWLSTWWRHYGLKPDAQARSQLSKLDDGHASPGPRAFVPGNASARLMVLGVYDEADRLVGLAPWYLHYSPAKGQVLRWLGSGEVCSEYLSILCQAHDMDGVTEALAGYLTGPNCAQGGPHAWDVLEIDGVAANDPPVTQLLQRLAERKCTQHANSPVRCWRLALPESWEAYLMKVSKGHRKKLRRADRDLFCTGRATTHSAQNAGELDKAWEALVDLHQKRRQMLGEPGCFASPQFAAFHREVTQALLAAGQLQLFWLELDGRTVAIDYQMTSQGITYVYQAGIDTARMAEEPGHLMTAATIKWAITQGGRAVDFLRGDEPYKPHFRAEPQAMLSLRVVPNRPWPRLRNQIYLASRQIKRWLTKSGPGYEAATIAAVDGDEQNSLREYDLLPAGS